MSDQFQKDFHAAMDVKIREAKTTLRIVTALMCLKIVSPLFSLAVLIYCFVTGFSSFKIFLILTGVGAMFFFAAKERDCASFNRR